MKKINHNFDSDSLKMFDDNGNAIYYETLNGYWVKQKFDSYRQDPNKLEKIIAKKTIAKEFNHNFDNGPFKIFNENNNKIYNEDFLEFWEKREFDGNNNMIYYENSNEYWIKYDFDDNGNKTYYEDSAGFWIKRKFDENDIEIYYEESHVDI